MASERGKGFLSATTKMKILEKITKESDSLVVISCVDIPE